MHNIFLLISLNLTFFSNKILKYLQLLLKKYQEILFKIPRICKNPEKKFVICFNARLHTKLEMVLIQLFIKIFLKDD